MYRRRAPTFASNDTTVDLAIVPTRTPPTAHAASLATLVRVLVVALALALLAPALALADASAGTATAEPAAAEQPAAGSPEGGAPAPEQPAPAGEPAQAEPTPAEPAAEAPAPEPAPAPAQEPAQPEPAPAPPPVVDEAPAPPPASPDASAPAPAPAPAPARNVEAPGTAAPVPVAGPVLAPALPELAPGMGATPDAPGARVLLPPMPPASAAPLVLRLGAVPMPPAGLAGPVASAPLVLALGGPTVPAEAPRSLVPAARPTADGPPLLLVDTGFSAAVLRDPLRGPTAATTGPAPGRSSATGPDRTFDDRSDEAEFPVVQVVAPEGTAPNGASLLEVLAGYVMPGSSGPPGIEHHLPDPAGHPPAGGLRAAPVGVRAAPPARPDRPAQRPRHGGPPPRLVDPRPGRGASSTRAFASRAAPPTSRGRRRNSREMGYRQMHHQTQILVLGSDGAGRSALEETLTRLGYVVLAAEASAQRTPPASGDIVMLDLRGEDADWRQLAEGLHADERPMMIISERPRRLVRALSGRAAGTMVMTGAESDAGYRVALSVCAALRRSSLERRAAAGITRRGDLMGVAPTMHHRPAVGGRPSPDGARAAASRGIGSDAMPPGLTNSYRRAGGGAVETGNPPLGATPRSRGLRALARGAIVMGSRDGARLRPMGNQRGETPRPAPLVDRAVIFRAMRIAAASSSRPRTPPHSPHPRSRRRYGGAPT